MPLALLQEELTRCFFRHKKLDDGTVGVVVKHNGQDQVRRGMKTLLEPSQSGCDLKFNRVIFLPLRC
jgi:hypothetical protein